MKRKILNRLYGRAVLLFLLLFISCNNNGKQNTSCDIVIFEKLNNAQQNQILQQINDIRIEYYKKKDIDQDLLYEIINIICKNKKKEEFSFNLYLLVDISKKSDGAIGERLASCMFYLFKNNTYYFIKYLDFVLNEKEDEEIYNIVVNQISNEIYLHQYSLKEIEHLFESINISCLSSSEYTTLNKLIENLKTNSM